MENNAPKTIGELRAWYAQMNLPPEEVTRFFIGENITERRAFGIYREGEEFIVYKNKDDGSRAIRYRGPDEAYAVNELYMRLRQEIAHQKSLTPEGREKLAKQKKKQKRLTIVVVIVILVIVVGAFVMELLSPSRGYYAYNNSMYYYLGSTWYLYENDEWKPTEVYGDLSEDPGSCYLGEDYSNAYPASDFASTDYYEDYSESSDSWSSSDSWDSGSTDFSSDW